MSVLKKSGKETGNVLLVVLAAMRKRFVDTVVVDENEVAKSIENLAFFLFSFLKTQPSTSPCTVYLSVLLI